MAGWLAKGWRDITRRVIHINAMAHALSELKAVDEEIVRETVTDYVLIQIMLEKKD